jgi:hypothetical protein
MSLGLQMPLSGDEVVRDMKLTIVLYILSLWLQSSLYLKIKLSGM